MQFKEGYLWKACYDEDRNLYTAAFYGDGTHLYEINEGIFSELNESVGNEACLLFGKGRKLYMNVIDRCGPPYTVVLDEDYRELCPWAHVSAVGEQWPTEMVDAVAEVLDSQQNNREQRRQKRAQRDREKDAADESAALRPSIARRNGGRPVNTETEFRKIFDTIPEQFDKFRPHYSAELFRDLIAYAGIAPGKAVLELGPGTGQATEPILRTGCDYHAVELGEHLCEKMKSKYGGYANFHIVNDDFITHDFGGQRFDMIYSAAAIQWIPEEVAFSKTFRLLKPGGTLAMMLISGDYRTPNEPLFERIQAVYDACFKPEIPYAHGSFPYRKAPAYGYTEVERRDYAGTRTYTADEYVSYCGTHSDHLVIPEPYRTAFFSGLREAVLAFGNRIVFRDTHVLYLTKKPENPGGA